MRVLAELGMDNGQKTLCDRELSTYNERVTTVGWSLGQQLRINLPPISSATAGHEKDPAGGRGQFFPMETTKGIYHTAAQNGFGCRNITLARNRRKSGRVSGARPAGAGSLALGNGPINYFNDH